MVSLDIEPNRLLFKHPRAEYLAMDATGSSVAQELVHAGHDGFDVIVDDGSHVPADQVKSLGCLWDLLRDEGTYVIEDVDVTNNPAVLADIQACADRLVADVQVFDLRQNTGRFDDVIVALTKAKATAKARAKAKL